MGLSRLWRRGAEKLAVKCIDCGCFHMHPALDKPAGEAPAELTREEREAVRAGGCPPGWRLCWPCCARGLDFQTEREKLREQRRQVTTTADLRRRPPGVERENLREKYLKGRQCDHFIEHIPGLTPQQQIDHNVREKAEAERENERRKWERRQKALWAAIGVVLTLLGKVAFDLAKALFRYLGFLS